MIVGERNCDETRQASGKAASESFKLKALATGGK